MDADENFKENRGIIKRSHNDDSTSAMEQNMEVDELFQQQTAMITLSSANRSINAMRSWLTRNRSGAAVKSKQHENPLNLNADKQNTALEIWRMLTQILQSASTYFAVYPWKVFTKTQFTPKCKLNHLVFF